MANFSPASSKELSTVDIRLQHLFNEVVKHWDCQVLDGIRTEAEQIKNVQKGVSQTMKSKHLDGLAVDVAPYPVDWKDTQRFYAFGGFVLGVASQMGIKIRWGGDWNGNRDLKDQTFFDLPHFELVE